MFATIKQVGAAPVSIAQLVLGVIAAIGSAGGFFILSEHRQTIVEERQAFVLQYITSDQIDTKARRAELAAKMDVLTIAIAQLSADLARHQAVSEAMAAHELGTRPKELRLPAIR